MHMHDDNKKKPKGNKGLIPKRIGHSSSAHTQHVPTKKEKSKIFTYISRFIMLTLTAIMLGILSIIIALWYWGRDLPDSSVLKTYEPAISSRVYAGDGNLIAQYAKQRRIFMPIESIPDRLTNAFIAAEDSNFYNHIGVDGIALLRAVVSNMSRIINGRRAIGASTITQQVAKNFFLTSERTISRKVKEAILAIRIDKSLSKNRILELYLNEIYLGRGAYGIAAASMRYFNKPPSKLSIAEVAYLAALPKAPNNYHPINKKNRAINRRNWVLKRMWQEGYITSEELKNAQQQPLDAMQGKEPNIIEAGYFLEETRREVFENFGETGLYESGLSIHTTLNSQYQKYAHTALRKALLQYDQRHGYRGAIANLENTSANKRFKRFVKIPPQAGTLNWKQALITQVNSQNATALLKDGSKITISFSAVSWARPYRPYRAGPKPNKIGDVLKIHEVILIEEISSPHNTDKNTKKYILRQVPQINGAIVALDPHTGRILAMVGGWDFSVSKFNRATQAKRQPGSSVKPFVYLSALNNGETPATRIQDAPFVLTLENGEKWKPRNFSNKFYGTSLMRVGLEQSRNLMTVRLAQKVGIKKILNTFKKFGVMKTPKPYLSYTLGAGESTLINMAAGYAMLINGGKKVTPSLIDRIQNRYGKIVYKHITQPCSSCGILSDKMPIPKDMRQTMTNPINAYQVVTMMEGVVQRGTGHPLKEFKIPMAGKTGTTNDGKDAWFISSTPDLIVGAYLGFDNPKSLGKRPPNKRYNWWTQETGATVALPAVKAFYTQIYKDLPAVPFRIPAGVRMVRIDPKTGGVATKKTINPQMEAFIPGTEPTSAGNNIISNTPTKDTNAIGIQDVY